MNAITHTPQVRTLLLTDLVDSTHLVERLGDSAAAGLFRAHDRMVLELQQRWRGRLIDRSDGLLLLFERPIDGLGFALDYVRGLRDLGREQNLKQPLQARAGLHVGEVLVWENSVDAVRLGAKSLEVEGLAKPLAGRLMALARPGQILLSATAEPLAHRAARELGERGELLVWKSYGRWRFKGVPEAQEVFEVGEPGLAPLRMPSHTPKAWRDLPLWRRPVALAAETVLLAGLALSGWFLTRPQPAIAFAERDWVVVGDLRNLTGDPRLDDSLEQAFRISLEQSRYVNVLSDLKVRETLERMQKKPDAQVDRAVGSEIAQRDGARALLLPTVAEVGGRLRVSAEVVDPRTQTTVYAVSADGKGIDSALASIDQVSDGLREKLGEAMQNVEKTSVPLPNVATPNLDALKAYAVARQMQVTGEQTIDAVIAMYKRAIELDPGFALAYAGIGGVYGAAGYLVEAREHWLKALSMKERLSPEEQLRIQVLMSRFGPPAGQISTAQRYLQLYPDKYDIRMQLAQMYWRANDFPAAEAQARLVVVPAAENLGANYYMLGIALLGRDRYAGAIAAFRKSREAGYKGAGVLYARAYDAQRQHAEADRILQSLIARRQGGSFGSDAIVTLLDRGQWRQAGQLTRNELDKALAGKSLVEEAIFRASLLKQLALARDPGAGAAVRDELQWLGRNAASLRAIMASFTDDYALMIGAAAATADDEAGLRAVLAQLDGGKPLAADPMQQHYQALLAELARLQGKPAEAVKRLQPIAAREDALLVTRMAYLRALRAAGMQDKALAQARWLAGHRGRAFAESANAVQLEEISVAGSTLALLDQAEIESALGRKQDAAASLRRFKAAWPVAELPRPLQARVAKLEGAPSGL